MRKTFMGLIIAMLVLALAACGGKKSSENASEVKGSDYPTKQIELIVPYAAGGGTDSVARAFADAAKNHLSQPMGVVNKVGGGGAVGMTEGSSAKPDGYKVTLVTVEMVTLHNLGLAAFTPNDFTPVARLNADPAAITVSADAPWNTVDEFIEYAKQNPGKIRIGNSGSGAIWHLAALSLEEKTGAKFNHIPFEGAAPAVTALLGGHIEAVTVSPGEVASQVENGKLKILGVMSADRLEKYQDVPTLKENGIDLEIGTWRGLAVPKDTPQDVVDVLKETAQKVTEEQSFQDVLSNMNLGLSYADNEEFQNQINKEDESFKAIIDKLGLKK
ncbi:MAG TPA: tripartite tricarboxylate transporter substrate binding protein [Pseudoneobacillus sp.]|nr:tripartite tricarboxylate transporter substrate binding protein [Pseudoneobacillus sp.]